MDVAVQGGASTRVPKLSTRQHREAGMARAEAAAAAAAVVVLGVEPAADADAADEEEPQRSLAAVGG